MAKINRPATPREATTPARAAPQPAQATTAPAPGPSPQKVAFDAKADELKTVLYCRMVDMKNIALLAAFACEARAQLNDLHDIGDLIPVMKSVIRSRPRHSEWRCYEDVSGQVLETLARDIGTCADDIEARIDDLIGGCHDVQS